MYKFRTLGEGSEKADRRAPAHRSGRFLHARSANSSRSRNSTRSRSSSTCLRGEMNFAGPRPLRPVFLERYLEEIPNYAERFRVAPGMTGLAQVRGGYFTSARNKLRFRSALYPAPLAAARCTARLRSRPSRF